MTFSSLDHTSVQNRSLEYLSPLGLVPLGWFHHDNHHTSVFPSLLIGDQAGSHWNSYCKESNDGKLSMDDWTRIKIAPLADELNAIAYYPFGDDVHPFQQWAIQATGMHPSPLGILIHPDFGLWTALRAALIFSHDDFPIPPPPTLEHPCETCESRACLSACPVDAFTTSTYDVDSCRSHVSSPAGILCSSEGCRARLACPIGTEHAYTSPQQSFHMRSFLNSK